MEDYSSRGGKTGLKLIQNDLVVGTFGEANLVRPKYTGKGRRRSTQGQCFSTSLCFLCHLNTGILGGHPSITG